MKPPVLALAAVGLSLAALTDIASAHSGRRFNIYVVEGRLEAQGINTGTADGAPATRPYPNAIHDHWRNVPGAPAATASLPGFDVPPRSDASLWGQRLDLELISVSKWVNPPSMPGPETVPLLAPLDAEEQILVNGPQGVVSSDSLGTLNLLGSVSPAGNLDLDLLYQVNRVPAGELHVLEMILRATPSAGGSVTLLPSRLIFVILAPAMGSGPSLHGAALFLERHLGLGIPEPTSAGLIFAALAAGFGRRIRRRG
jgi:hypothetical protein